jgi:hypothetical protein
MLYPLGIVPQCKNAAYRISGKGIEVRIEPESGCAIGAKNAVILSANFKKDMRVILRR